MLQKSYHNTACGKWATSSLVHAWIFPFGTTITLYHCVSYAIVLNKIHQFGTNAKIKRRRINKYFIVGLGYSKLISKEKWKYDIRARESSAYTNYFNNAVKWIERYSTYPFLQLQIICRQIWENRWRCPTRRL